MKELYEFAINVIDTNPCPPFPIHMLPPIMQHDPNFELNQCLVDVIHTVMINAGKYVLYTLKIHLEGKESTH